MPSFCFQRRGDVEAVVLRSRAALGLNVITNFSDFQGEKSRARVPGMLFVVGLCN